MDRLVLAKRRAGRRRREDGAAMFVVAMTVAVLASVGVFALAAAANEVQTSGNERRTTQTHFLASYGVLGSAQTLSSTLGQFYRQLMKNPATREKTCLSLTGISSTAPDANHYCYRLEPDNFQKGWAVPITEPYASKPYSPTVAPGSFGTTPINGFFFVELTDPIELRPKRYSDQCAEMVTATSYGHTQPLFPGVSNPLTAQYGGESVQVQRARLMIMPVPCEQGTR
jgi:hypothetical protein